MAGWRIGFALGNSEIIRLITLLQEHYFVSLFPAVQRAAITALTSSQECVREQCSIYQRRRDILVQGLDRIGWDCSVPRGSVFAWTAIPYEMSSEEFAYHLLEHAHLALTPGSYFGANGEGYLRIGLVSAEEKLQEAINRLALLTL